MAQLEKILGRHRDISLTKTALVPAVVAGTGADFEHAVFYVPTLPDSSGEASTLAMTAQNLRSITAVFETNLTGAATNNFTLQFNIRRAGAIVGSPLASVTYGSGTNETAFVAHEFPIQLSSSLVLLPGDVVTVQRVSAGTGLASPAFSVFCDPIPSGVNA